MEKTHKKVRRTKKEKRVKAYAVYVKAYGGIVATFKEVDHAIGFLSGVSMVSVGYEFEILPCEIIINLDK